MNKTSSFCVLLNCTKLSADEDTFLYTEKKKLYCKFVLNTDTQKYCFHSKPGLHIKK